LWLTRSILVTTFIGLLFAVAIMPAVDWLERHRVPRALGAAIVVLAIFGALFAIATLLAPVLQGQAGELRQRIPEAVDRIEQELLRRHIISTSVEGGAESAL